MNKLFVFFLISLLLITWSTALAQTTPVGMPVFEEYMRRQQLLGD